jgi:ABC-type branched-subunit amino acid transport system substrate-binding protein
MKKQVLWLLLATVVIIGGVYWYNTQNRNQKEKFKIAVNIPLTGPIAAWSGQFPNGFNMGIEDACKKFNIDPTIFEVDYQDNQGNPGKSVLAFQKQKLSGFDLLVSVSTIPVNSYGSEADILNKPHFIAAFDPFITKTNSNRLRLMANSKIEAPLFVDYATKRSAKKIFIVQLNLSYAEEEFGKIVQPALEKKGISVKRELFDISVRDFKNITSKIREYKPDLIFICGYSFHVQPLIKDLRTANLIKSGNVLSVMDFVDLIYSDIPVTELREVAFVCPDFDIQGKVNSEKDWREVYFTKFKMKPTYVPAYAYDNATLIVKSYAENNGRVTNETILKSLPFDGINGSILMDEDRDIRSTLTLAILDENGKVSEIKK